MILFHATCSILQSVHVKTVYIDNCSTLLLYVVTVITPHGYILVNGHVKVSLTVISAFFACPLFREFREPDNLTKITGRDNLNTIAFQCRLVVSKNAQITRSKTIQLIQTPKLSVAEINGFTVLSSLARRAPRLNVKGAD